VWTWRKRLQRRPPLRPPLFDCHGDCRSFLETLALRRLGEQIIFCFPPLPFSLIKSISWFEVASLTFLLPQCVRDSPAAAKMARCYSRGPATLWPLTTAPTPSLARCLTQRLPNTSRETTVLRWACATTANVGDELRNLVLA